VRREGGDTVIYRYDFGKNIWSKIRKIKVRTPSVYSHHHHDEQMAAIGRRFRAWNHGHAVCDAQCDGLWVFGNDGILGRFDLRNVSEHRVKDLFFEIGPNAVEYPSSVFVGETMHVFGETVAAKGTVRKSVHFEFDGKSHSFKQSVLEDDHHLIVRDEADRDHEEQNDDENRNEEREHKESAESEGTEPLFPCFYCCKLVHIEHLDEIWIFNGSNGNTAIWSYSIERGTFRILRGVLLPKRNTNNFGVTLVRDRILMVCYVECKEMVAMDLKADRKWRKKTVDTVRGMSADCSMVNCKDHWIHFVNTIAPQHVMVWQYHLVPQPYLDTVFAPMVVDGYVREGNAAIYDLDGLHEMVADPGALIRAYCLPFIFE